MLDANQIPLSHLEVGCWYVGRGRNSNIGQWNGNSFIVIADCLVYNGSFSTPQETRLGIKFEPYYTEEEGCFQPFLKIDEGETIKSKEDHWDKKYGYGEVIRFGA